LNLGFTSLLPSALATTEQVFFTQLLGWASTDLSEMVEKWSFRELVWHFKQRCHNMRRHSHKKVE